MQVRILAVRIENNSSTTIAQQMVEVKNVRDLKRLLPLSLMRKLQLHKLGDHAHLTGRGSNFKLTIWLGDRGSYILDELLHLIWEVR